jgi:phosphoribosylanthranilate isomerase
MTRIKICGLRDAENALVAARAGADLLGFNFVEGVRRQLRVDEGVEVIEAYRESHGPAGPKVVGLFADQTVEFINATVQRCGLDLVQLCGNEPPTLWSALDARVIRQVKVRDDSPRRVAVDEVRRKVDEAVSAGHMAVLDKYQKGLLGGTGLSFDWRVAAEVAGQFDLLLAGGLTPQNVNAAIEAARPWGVDVSSGVETDGLKDPSKIVAFAEAVRNAG